MTRTSLIPAILPALISLSLPACERHEEGAEPENHTIVVTSPRAMDVTVSRQYVCQIHARRHINVRALQDGYLQAIRIKEGQQVKEGQELFSVIPILYEAKYEAEKAEANLAGLEFKYAKNLADQKAVSQKEVALYQAKLANANAKKILAERELNFTKVKAPFDGIVDRLHEQQGSLIKERDILTTLSDNSVMWVYFNVPEKQYIQYMALSAQDKAEERIELLLAGGIKFTQLGKIGAIEAQFNNETGTVPFRADFPNPDRLLRHGMTGTIMIHKKLRNAILIPQRATYDIHETKYVYVVDKDNIVHQREIVKEYEMPDIFVIKKGIGVDDKIVFEGVRELHDGQKVEYEFRPLEQILPHQEYHAE